MTSDFQTVGLRNQFNGLQAALKHKEQNRAERNKMSFCLFIQVVRVSTSFKKWVLFKALCIRHMATTLRCKMFPEF